MVTTPAFPLTMDKIDIMESPRMKEKNVLSTLVRFGCCRTTQVQQVSICKHTHSDQWRFLVFFITLQNQHNIGDFLALEKKFTKMVKEWVGSIKTPRS